MPPSDAPIAIGRLPLRCSQCRGDRRRVRGKIREGVIAARDPLAVAVAALVERISHRARTRQMLGGSPPGVARLSAAMQQHHRLARIAIDVGDQPVAGGAGEYRGRGLKMFHGCKNFWTTCRNLIASAL